MLKGQCVTLQIHAGKQGLCVWSDPKFSLAGSDPTGLPWGRVSLFGTIGCLDEDPGLPLFFVLPAATWEGMPLASSCSSGTLLPCLGAG